MPRGSYGFGTLISEPLQDASESEHGLMTPAQVTKLVGIDDGADLNVIEDVTVSTTTTALTYSNGGIAAKLKTLILNIANAVANGAAGLMTGADKAKLDAATNANTASAIVRRDASGNFSAGTITAGLTGTASNATNAATAYALDVNGPDKQKLNGIDVTTGYVSMEGLTWSRKQLADGKYMYSARVSITLAAAQDQYVGPYTYPDLATFQTVDSVITYYGKNSGQINASLRPPLNGEPTGSDATFQIALSTVDGLNLSAKGITGVVTVVCIER